MDTNAMVWIGLAIGSTIGGAIPLIWGASLLSISSIIFSAIGGIAGIYFGYKIGGQ